MKNFANYALVSGFVQSENGNLTRENWGDFERRTVAKIADLLGIDAEKAKEIFLDGINSLLTTKKQAV
jgi:hypothetical protein